MRLGSHCHTYAHTNTFPTPTPSTPAPYTINTASKAGIGDYLVAARGMTLYYFTNDTIGISNATGAFLQNWPIFNASNFVVPASLNAANFSTITRSDGLKQATYKGWPLYYYAKDQVAGDTLGNGVGSVWFVINPADFPPPPLTTTPPPTITPPADGGGGGY